MNFNQEDQTVFKRSAKGKKLKEDAVPKWLRVKFKDRDLELTRKVIIGRDANCQIAYPEDTLVSRRHAELDVVGSSVYITDLGSTNGTYVNKEPVQKGKKVQLQKGDTIIIGNQRLKIT